MRRIAPILIAAVLLGGCTSQNLASSVESFDSSVSKAVKAHNAQLDTIVSRHDAELRDRLAEESARLAPAEACDDVLGSNAAQRAKLVADCTIERVNLQGARIPVDAAPIRVARLKAVGNALAAYSSSLRLLYADASADKKTFGTAVNGLAAAVGGLQGQVERATGKTGVSQEALDAVASLAADFGAQYFEYKRSKVLRDLISQSHPVVVAATDVLEQSSEAAEQSMIAGTAHAELDQAKNDLRSLLGRTPSKAQVRAAQDRLFKAHADFVEAISVASPFGQIRTAHEAMVKAAEAGLSTVEMIALTEELVKLAGRVEVQVKTLEEEL